VEWEIGSWRGTLLNEINIFEVGPRDGLQNESFILTVEQKVKLIQGLIQAGLKNIEVGSWVREDRLPQMANTEEVLNQLKTIAALKVNDGVNNEVKTWTLVPNQKGFDRALQAGVKNIALFTATSDTFTQNNIGMSVQQSLDEFKKIAEQALRQGIQVRGYVSTAFGCPYEGVIQESQTLKVIEALIHMGAFQVSVGDTIGVATPRKIQNIMKPAVQQFGAPKIAGHYHDTRGTALANVVRSLDCGVTTFDSSIGGLGGCPYAPGASGNCATEDLIYLLKGEGFTTGVDLDALTQQTLSFFKEIQKPVTSKYLQACRAP
jgi:hydroxymethylglutaryl-CoA lyase